MSGPLVCLCGLRGRLFEVVTAEVGRQVPGFELVLQEPGDEYAYTRDLIGLWGQGRPLVIVEADVLPAPGAIRDVLECERPWCGFEVWTGERYDAHTLGLCRFGPALIRDASLALRAWSDPRTPSGLRSILRSPDVAIARVLWGRGFEVHLHRPPPVHLRYANDPLLGPRLPGYRPPDPGPGVDVRRPR